MSFIKKIRWTVLIIVLVAITANGCLKNSDLKPSDVGSYISIMQLAPASPATEAYINNKIFTVPMGIGDFFGQYISIPTGRQEVEFKKAGFDSLIAIMPAADFDSLAFYTVVLYNDPQGNGAKATRISDDYSQISGDKAAWRFLNMCPDAGSVDLYVNDVKVTSGRTHADNFTNNSLNEFQPYSPGIYDLTVKLSGTDSVLAKMSSYAFQTANAYTVFLKGLSHGSGNSALSMNVLKSAN